MKKFIVLDTETAPTKDCPKDNKAHAECSNVYDLGYIVADRKGNIYERKSLLIPEVFFNNDLMNSAYYANKRPIYKQGIATGEWVDRNFKDAYKEFADICKQYRIKEVWAYNSDFDKAALNRTIQDLSGGWRNWFFPYGVKVLDIWRYAGDTICDTDKYAKWCIANGYVSGKGNPQTSAEIVHRYTTADLDFTEAHTALNDCEIELGILLRVLKRRKRKPTKTGNGWRKAAKRAEKLRATA